MKISTTIRPETNINVLCCHLSARQICYMILITKNRTKMISGTIEGLISGVHDGVRDEKLVPKMKNVSG